MTPCSSNARVRRQVDRLFARGLSPGRHERLRSHLRDCDVCRHHYERVRGLEDALFDAPEPLNPAALERIADLVVPPAPETRRSGKLSMFGLAVAAATVAVVALIAVPPDPDLRSKSVGTLPPEGGITVFHVDPETRSVQRLARLPEGSPLASGSVVQIAYTNTTFTHAVVIGVDASYGLQWYHPSSAEVSAGGVLLRPAAADALFGEAWTIKAPAGPLRLYAVFSRDPIDAAAIDVAVSALRQSGGSLRDADELPGIGAHQDSVLLEIRP
ncbi:MAG: hypothetical protein V3T05_07470 [Myxococcota bacterium]